MQFMVLGPLRVLAGDTDEPRVISAARLRTLLAVLLWRANEPVPAGELAELVWDSSPPSGAPEATRSLVMRLRRQLGTLAAARIVTRAPGYMIELSSAELDASQFETLTQQAGAAVRAGRWRQAARTAASALGLWRGTPLADVPSQTLLDQWVPHLEQLRMQALDWRIESDLHEGRHEQLIPELQDLAARHPLREHVHGQLMLGLYRCGRQAEALAAYRRARDILVGELGVEPGPGLRELHQRILSADPDLITPGPTRPSQAEAEQVTPRELPPAVRGFTGRSAELLALTALLDRSRDQAPTAVVISAIGGTAGVGKTTLAVQWAHQVAEQFPDGQLYVNLRGHDLDQPMPAADALAGFLRSLGVPGQDIPPDTQQRAARYRSLLAGRRLLVVLDNAGSADQVRPLLPGAPACTVLVTSRNALAGLVARDGAARLDLDVLPPPDAVTLLRTLIGTRVDAEPEAAAELASQCCRLPLALRVAAELAVTRQAAASLAALAGELADLRTRLDLLDAGEDPHTGVRAVFSWSYRQLGADAARMFRLLGLHPGPHIEPYAAAALTGSTVQQARRDLDGLARSHLIQPAGPGRYDMHDLLRAYACELTDTEEDQDDRHAALTRLYDHYLHTAATAMDALFPAAHHSRYQIPPPGGPTPPVASAAQARAWLDSQRPTLIIMAGQAARGSCPQHAVMLAATLAYYLRGGGYYPEAMVIHGHALRAARAAADRAAQAAALTDLGMVDWKQGRWQAAAARLAQAVALFRSTGDQRGEGDALVGLALIDIQRGQSQQATSRLERSVALYNAAGHLPGAAHAVGDLGGIDMLQGRYDQAAARLHQSITLARQAGNRPLQAHALSRLGSLETRLGRFPQAIAYQSQAMAIFCEIGNRNGQATVHVRLSRTALRDGRCQQARDHAGDALALFRETGDGPGEAEALGSMAAVDLREGRYEQAADHLDRSIALAGETGERLVEASSLTMLGDTRQRQGHTTQAADCYQHALDLLRESGERLGQADALNGLGELALAASQPGQACRQHTAALDLATETRQPAEQARAHNGLADACLALGQTANARHHRELALELSAAWFGVADLAGPC